MTALFNGAAPGSLSYNQPARRLGGAGMTDQGHVRGRVRQGPVSHEGGAFSVVRYLIELNGAPQRVAVETVATAFLVRLPSA